MDNKLVTIGIPFHNAASFLDSAIRSVINQTYQNWELILLDDGSCDQSLAIAKSYHDPRIVVISDGHNKGLVYRLNQLTAMAHGQLYARMDADDIMHFERIKTQVDFLNHNPEVDVVGSNYFSIDARDNIIGKSNYLPHPDTIQKIIKYGCFAHPSVMGNIDWFRKFQYNYNCDRMEDFELWIRTVRTSNFRNIASPLLFYRNVNVTTLQKYFKSNVGIMKILHHSKIYGINNYMAAKYRVLFGLKILVYILFFIIGRMDWLVAKRSESLNNADLSKAQIDLIDSTFFSK